MRWKEYFERLLIGKEGSDQSTCKKIIKGKAVGHDGIRAEAWKTLGVEGITILGDLFEMYEQEEIVYECRKSFIVPIFKEKGDIQDCSNDTGIKLISNKMKILERIINQKLGEVVEISSEKFGFMPMYTLRQLMERYREGQKTLIVNFIDLE
ncbi:uncharacterized protein [Palaemon carinicauda]|uniref:uncharacterized protein n=1 Tax=Palaemon carinicauda TaxID=392227 RepID=UPI0035B5DFEC